MNYLININMDTQTVSARELHEKLNIGAEFAKRFSRMCEYGFNAENDYSEVIVKNDENSKGGRPATDYNISVDIAKGLPKQPHYKSIPVSAVVTSILSTVVPAVISSVVSAVMTAWRTRRASTAAPVKIIVHSLPPFSFML